MQLTSVWGAEPTAMPRDRWIGPALHMAWAIDEPVGPTAATERARLNSRP